MSRIIDARSGIDATTLQQIADSVRSGELVVIPTDTSYAVICDAFHATAVTSVRIAKNQTSDVSLPIGAGSLQTINGVARLSTIAIDVANAFWPGPLTVLTPAQDSLSWNIGSRDNAVAVRVPQHETALQILGAIGPVVMTGAQQSMANSVVTIEEAQASLGDTVAYYVDAGQLNGSASSVLDATTDSLRLLREGALTLAQLRDVAPMIIKATT